MYETKNLFVYGTRPELIKLWPVMDKTEDKYVVCTGQHKELLDKNLIAEPDHDMNLFQTNRRLLATMDLIMGMLSWVFEWRKPERVIVLGDTATAFAAAQAAFHEGYSVAHIEAGLRTHNKNQPFPEEVYRQFISSVADIHFAPTIHAANQLKSGRVLITGNPVIDAVKILAPEPTQSMEIVVTLHRRESPVEEYGKALAELIEKNPRYMFKVVIHPNQQGQKLKSILGPLAGLPNLYLLPPMGYFEFLQLMASCYMVITDSGGLQEEAPTLNKPVIVMREVTERPEGILAGTAILAPPQDLVKIAEELMYVVTSYMRMADNENPFGDGLASGRIAAVLND